MLKRAQHTLDLILDEIGQTGLPTSEDLALNERDYGDLSGLNKDDARKKWGEEQVLIWRRSYDVPPPGGESLKDTLARALPYYVQEILPGVLRGERTLVAAHGNSLRALIMVLESSRRRQILKRELAHRRADHLPAQCGFDGGVEARSGGLTGLVRCGAAGQIFSVVPARRPGPITTGSVAMLVVLGLRTTPLASHRAVWVPAPRCAIAH